MDELTLFIAQIARAKEFVSTYRETLAKHGMDPHLPDKALLAFFKELEKNKDFSFPLYHQKNAASTQIALEAFRLLVDEKNSTVTGLDVLQNIQSSLKKGENVVLFANHQSEADPYAMRLLLEKIAPEYVDEIIWVAGERVVTDTWCKPGSLGTNLLCIYSKRYMTKENEHERKSHNVKAMQKARELLKEGGKCFYLAPSGGRDRPDSKGVFQVAPFDPKSIDLFYLTAKASKVKTRFFPLAMRTHTLFPPPQTVQKEIGEPRIAIRAPLHLAFCQEIVMESFASHEKRAQEIEKSVKEAYALFPKS